VALFDLQLPDGRGEDIVDELRGRNVAISPIIVLSALPEAELANATAQIEAATAKTVSNHSAVRDRAARNSVTFVS
jgi:DNA-binding response OmpR family regulator